ncbi:D-hexose-6-phosphate mutarotase [Pseudoduganella namucuonensis]|uniref:Putative glucose-6-phosphate 1-epimerase n=1 Tax=Pseudoduganella namucuonensis TaxID=1035707 RepID=A0A1I7FVX6_9BURK|nr:D-hexose-6-phosphate mutarotase [Pseudoduganella namucuonensis]SFU40300.1 glucose-6-phosphate 1-epimerase [Pseudoduganella namucuonensis]
MISQVTFGQLPAVSITAPDGAQAIVALYGAHLLSWKTADGKERLFLSERSPMDGGAAIRGGVPVIFPQFSTRGDGQRHGVARLSTWRLGATGDQGNMASAEFELTQDDVPARLAEGWPHAFALRLRFTLDGDTLHMDFNVANSGAADFDFACALHTYYAVGEFNRTSLRGLAQGDIAFGPALDNIYPAPERLELHTADTRLRLEQRGFSEWVVWNPGEQGAAALGDMADHEFHDFVCVEPARVDKRPLAAGAEWAGRHSITVVT